MSQPVARKKEQAQPVRPDRGLPKPDAAWEERVLSITPMKAYLLFYNILSCALWIQILLLTLSYVFTPHDPPSPITSSGSSGVDTARTILAPVLRLFHSTTGTPSSTLTSNAPKAVIKAIDQLRGSYHFMGLGMWVKVTQTLAVLDVVHAALGLVKSNVGTAASQVFSRLWAVWAVVEMVPEAKNHPLYTTMILAWSITETVRYAFYECALLGVDIPILTWARYNLFMVLYPVGASSEAFLSLSTLPPFSTLSLESILASCNPLTAIIKYLPQSLRTRVISTTVGRHALWTMARASVQKRTKDYWGFIEIARLVLFFVWWPALAVLMGHMFKLRAKVMRKGRTVGSKKTN